MSIKLLISVGLLIYCVKNNLAGISSCDKTYGYTKAEETYGALSDTEAGMGTEKQKCYWECTKKAAKVLKEDGNLNDERYRETFKKARDDHRLPYFDETINMYINECLTKIVGEGCAKTVESYLCVGNLTFEFDKLIHMEGCEEEVEIVDEEDYDSVETDINDEEDDYDPETRDESFRNNTLTDAQKCVYVCHYRKIYLHINENGTLDQEKIYTSLIRYLGKQVTEDHLKKHISECSTEGKDEEGKCTKAFDSLNCLISLWDKRSGK